MSGTSIIRFLSLVVLLTALISCGGSEAPAAGPVASTPSAGAVEPPQPPATAKPGLGGKMWCAQKVRGISITPPSESRRPYIVFDTDTLGVSGYGGCNTFRGTYSATAEAISMGPFSTTRMACRDIGGMESDFLSAIAQTHRYRATEESLEFMDIGGNVLVLLTPR